MQKPEEYAQSIVSKYLGNPEMLGEKEQELVRDIADGVNVFVSHSILDDNETIRDKIAIEAMKAIIIGMSIDTSDPDGGGEMHFFWSEVMNDRRTSDRSTLTENAYEIAEAMMETRKHPKSYFTKHQKNRKNDH